MYVFTDLSTFAFVCKNLSLRFGGSTEGGYFVLNTELVTVVNFVSIKVLTGGTVHEHHWFSSHDNFSLPLLKVSIDGLESPDSVVHLLVDDADFLVT